MDPYNEKLTVSRDEGFLTPEEIRATEPLMGNFLDYPFRPSEPAKFNEVPQ